MAKYWLGSAIEADDERQLCGSCGRETSNFLGICDTCLDENDEKTNDIKGGKVNEEENYEEN